MTTIPSFVSRGGLKLQHAIENFKLKIENLTVLDVGSSTGGFVDCLLQNGAAKVFSVDTAYGELAWKLRNDPRVVVLERTNILHLESLPMDSQKIPSPPAGEGQGEGDTSEKSDSPERSRRVDLITIDASWTKLELILPVVQKFLKENGYIIALLKPHYEAGKQMLIKGVLPDDQLETVKEKVFAKIKNLEFEIDQVTESPIQGGGGNREFLLLLKPKV